MVPLYNPKDFTLGSNSLIPTSTLGLKRYSHELYKHAKGHVQTKKCRGARCMLRNDNTADRPKVDRHPYREVSRLMPRKLSRFLTIACISIVTRRARLQGRVQIRSLAAGGGISLTPGARSK